MIEVIPAILPKSLNDIKLHFDQIPSFVKKVQVDIVDGKYSDFTTWPFLEKNSDDLLKLQRGEESFPYIRDFLVEVDMLVLHPIEYIPDLLGIGFRSFVIHIDSTDHVKECIETVKNAGCKVGIGIKPSGDMNLLESFLTQIDFVQFMGNDKVGHGGVSLDESVFKKIQNFKNRHPSLPVQVDIGVNFDTAPKLLEVGVTGLVSGSTIFNSPSVKDAIIKLQSL